MKWGNMRSVAKATIRAEVPRKTKRRLLTYLALDVLCAPFRALLWKLDDLFYRDYKWEDLEAPLFIIGQPRCGTTFLHRTLAQDRENFFAVTYLEWRFPYIVVWKLLDKLHLRNWVSSWCYWPNTRLGKLANKMHPHYFGDYEEHGVFLEEKFYCHYFIFRRFPFPEVLELVDYRLAPDKMLKDLLAVVRKVKYYHGYQGSWVTKENESAEFYNLLLGTFPDARVLFTDRNIEDSIRSYHKLSTMSTMAKAGIDPRTIYGWIRANDQFRMDQQIEYSLLQGRMKEAKTVYYEDLVRQIKEEVLDIYSYLHLPISEAHLRKLDAIEAYQKTRVRGY